MQKTDAKKEITAGIGKNIPESRQETEENILEVIYQWDCAGQEITRKKIGEHFGLSGHETAYYVKQMARHGYIAEASQSERLDLTDFGRYEGEECHYRHYMFTQFLQMIGLEREEAQEEACRLEHIVGERTVKGIADFLLNGDVYERSFTSSRLREQYEPGEYEFLMGLYCMDSRYPREFAEEFYLYSDTVILCVGEEESGFLLQGRLEKPKLVLWYQSPDGWRQAEKKARGEWLPAQAFEFTVTQGDLVMEGCLLTAFTREGEEPSEQKCRELNVHIWQGAENERSKG